MAVRVSKPPVNIREKLSELERPIGLNGSALMRTETPQEAFSLIGAGRKNLLINGDMRIDQRNSGSAVTRTTAQPTLYAIDRWIDYIDGGSYSLQRVADAPAGFLNSLKVTTLTSTSSTVIIQQYIEGVNSSVLSYGTSSAKHSTLSFWVKSSVAGKFSGHIGNPNPASLRSFVFTYRINATNTWEYKTITIPGETTGVWINTTSSGLKVLFNLGSGGLSATENAWSNGDFIKTTDSIGVISTTNATWQITGVQLEEGKVATPFERRSYGEELALCQRYYQKHLNPTLRGLSSSTTALNRLGTSLPVTMRDNPVLSVEGTFSWYDGNNTGTFTSANILATYSRPSFIEIEASAATGTTAAQLPIATYITGVVSYLICSSEI